MRVAAIAAATCSLRGLLPVADVGRRGADDGGRHGRMGEELLGAARLGLLTNGLEEAVSMCVCAMQGIGPSKTQQEVGPIDLP